MLAKLSPVVNFINILRTNFLYESAFLYLILVKKELSYEKCARKTLMKSTPDVKTQER
jgi:hypothetical protein